MNTIPLGLLLIASGLAVFIYGRILQERVTGPGIGRAWLSLPTPVRRIWRATDGALMIAALPTQLWGVVAVVVGGLIAVGIIPSGEPSTTALLVVLGPGSILLGLATVLTRFLPGARDEQQRSA